MTRARLNDTNFQFPAWKDAHDGLQKVALFLELPRRFFRFIQPIPKQRNLLFKTKDGNLYRGSIRVSLFISVNSNLS